VTVLAVPGGELLEILARRFDLIRAILSQVSKRLHDRDGAEGFDVVNELELKLAPGQNLDIDFMSAAAGLGFEEEAFQWPMNRVRIETSGRTRSPSASPASTTSMAIWSL
jgi:hypothetical protein